MKYPLASDASSEAVSKQPVSQCSESVYEEAPAVGPDEDDEDNGQNTELADHLLKEDGEKDALWEEVDGAAIKKEWKQRGSCGGLCSCPEVSRVWKGDEGLCERVRGRASQELFSSRQCYIYLANGVVNELYICGKGDVCRKPGWTHPEYSRTPCPPWRAIQPAYKGHIQHHPATRMKVLPTLIQHR
jgi:hypothetical protein